MNHDLVPTTSSQSLLRLKSQQLIYKILCLRRHLVMTPSPLSFALIYHLSHLIWIFDLH
jgi:hypothetical protein